MPAQTAVVEQETFAPLLYLLPYETFGEMAIACGATAAARGGCR